MGGVARNFFPAAATGGLLGVLRKVRCRTTPGGYCRRPGSGGTKTSGRVGQNTVTKDKRVVIVKKGENDLPGLTDTEKPRMRGPKRRVSPLLRSQG